MLFLLSVTGYAQVLISEDFDSSNGFPSGWSSPTLPAFTITPSNSCDGNSARGPLSTNSIAPELVYMSQVATGDDIIVSFDYKILQASNNNATDEDFGAFHLEYSIDDGKNWLTYRTIDETSHTPSSSCVNITDTILGSDVPAGSEFGWRVRGTHTQGNNYIYIDNFEAIEDVPCKQPIDLVIEEVTFDSIEISWTELNATPATEWEIAFCLEGTNPNQPACFLSNIITVTSNPYTITGLPDGTKFDIYVRSVCSTTSESAWSVFKQAQTVAIGTDCANPFSITNLPFNHTSDTEIYGNSYSGKPGAACSTSGDFLDGYDVVYKYTSTNDDILQIELSGNLDGDVGVFVYEACTDIGDTCFAGAITADGDDFGIYDLYVDAGQTYYIVVSTKGVDTTTEYTLDIEGFDCAGWNAPDGNATYEFYDQTLADYSETRIGVNYTIEGAVLKWYDDATLNNEITDLDFDLNDGDEFWVIQEVMGCTSPVLHVTFTEFDCNNLSITDVEATSMICDEGYTTIEAMAATDNLIWYDQEVGGEPIGVGSTFTTPILTETTSFWVSEFFRGEGMLSKQANPGPTTSQSYSIVAGVEFELFEPTVLLDVQVYITGSAGDLVVELTDAKGSIQQRTINVPGGSQNSPTPVVLNLDFEMNDPSDGPYQLKRISGPSMMGTPSSHTSFPYSLGNVGTVTSGVTNSSSTNYYYFYNWTVISSIPLCESARIEVEAVVNETKDITIDAVAMDVCVGGDADLTVLSDDADYEYEWEWIDENGVTQTELGNTIQPTLHQGTTFTVFAENPNTGCSTETDIFIDVVGVGEIPITPINANVCAGEIVALFAGEILHQFERDTISDWTFVNNSTAASGLTADRADWKQVSSPYTLADNATSNDNSKFMITSADALGPGSTVETEMISPSMNLVGVEDATLEFHHYYKHLTTKTTTAAVLISDDAGLTWNQVASYSTNQGSAESFSKVEIDLNNYLGSANVQVKFRYTGNWGWWWAVDNVSIAQTYANGQVTWTGTDSNLLYLDDNALVQYKGEPTNIVYFKGEETGIYEYDVDLYIEGCGNPVANTIEIEVTKAEKPIGDEQQDFPAGARVFDIDVQGQNLTYYIYNEDMELERQSINASLIDGETYYISQRINGCESEFLEVEVNFVCPVPSNLTVSPEASIDGLSASVIIFWEEPMQDDSVESYNVIIKENDVVIEDITVSKSRNYVIVENLEFDKEFEVALISVCDATNDVVSLPIEETFTTFGLGVDDLDTFNMNFYPNPVENSLTIESDLLMDKIEVIAVDGKSVKVFDNIQSNQTQLDLSNLSTGTYLLVTTGENQMKVMRIVKK